MMNKSVDVPEASASPERGDDAGEVWPSRVAVTSSAKQVAEIRAGMLLTVGLPVARVWQKTDLMFTERRRVPHYSLINVGDSL